MLSGVVDTYPVSVAEYSYTRTSTSTTRNADGTSSTSTSSTTYHFVVVVVRLPRPGPSVEVQPRHGLSKLGRAIFGDRATAIGYEPFDRAFRICGQGSRGRTASGRSGARARACQRAGAGVEPARARTADLRVGPPRRARDHPWPGGAADPGGQPPRALTVALSATGGLPRLRTIWAVTLSEAPRRPTVVLIVMIALWLRVALRLAAAALLYADPTAGDDAALLVWAFGVDGVDLYAMPGVVTVFPVWLVLLPFTAAYAVAAVLMTVRARRAWGAAFGVLLTSVLTGFPVLALALVSDDGPPELFLKVWPAVGPGASLVLLGLLFRPAGAPVPAGPGPGPGPGSVAEPGGLHPDPLVGGVVHRPEG